MNFSDRTKIAIEIAQKAGEVTLKGFRGSFEVSSKSGKHNLVTEYDFASEKLIYEHLQEKFPKDSFLAEEEGFKGDKTSEIEWVVDPLDGTVNYAHGIPVYAISIAARRDKELLLGVIYQPITKELFVAERNKGAYRNGKEIRVTTTPKLSEAILATGFPYNVEEDPHHCIQKLSSFLHMGVPVRRLGAAAIDLAYVASGQFDGFFEASLKPWDLAAGVLVIEEAGGKVSNWNNEELDIDSDDPIMATNTLIHDEMQTYLSGE